MAATNKMRTPKGKYITAKQYLALAQRNDQPCEHGHFGCAAWDRGPCSDELQCMLDLDGDFFFDNSEMPPISR